jgi:nucleotide-binding universal stress UspA family protein
MASIASPTVVLAAVDYSNSSRDALRKAFERAHGEASALHVVHVVESDQDESGADRASEQLREFVNDELKSWDKAKVSDIPMVVTHVLTGRPANQIAQLASDLDAQVLVVGAHGERGIHRLLLGSTTDRIVRLSTVPVLVVPSMAQDASATAPEIAPACPQCIAVRRASGGKQLWCEEHRRRHDRRHTFHYIDRNVGGRTANSLLINVRDTSS